jgi:hypothetical protein
MLPVQIKSGSSKQVCAIRVNMRSFELFQRLTFEVAVGVILTHGNGPIGERYTATIPE